jgi:hypothetical protein
MTEVSPRAVHAALVLRGWSASSWARARGFKADTVRRVIHRWAGRTDRVPYGTESRQIIADLQADLGLQIVPGIAPSAPPTHDQNAA